MRENCEGEWNSIIILSETFVVLTADIKTPRRFKCLSEMAYTTGCCSLKAQFIPLGIAFGSIRKRLE